MTTLKGKDEGDNGDDGCGGTTVVIRQSNDVAKTKPFLQMMKRRGRDGDGVPWW